MKEKTKQTIAITTALSILTLAIAFTVDYTNLKAQVGVDGRDITEVKVLINSLSDKLEKTNDSLTLTNTNMTRLNTLIDTVLNNN